MFSPTRPIVPAVARALTLGLALLTALTVLTATPATAGSAVGRPAQLLSTRPAALSTSQLARRMLGLLNSERHRLGRAPLRMNAKLVESATRHTTRMVARNVLSHQLGGERNFAARISATGYDWTAVGENIGWSTNVSLAGLQALERAMFNEKPPNDGHRQNILSRSFRQIGIAVRRDPRHHKIWFTQDFGRPA